MERESSKRRGRPRINPEGTRANITFQCSHDVKARLLSRAEAEGNSLSRTIEDVLRERFEMADIATLIREELRTAMARSEPG